MTVTDRDFSPRLLQLREDPPGPLPRVMVGVLALLLLGLLVWALVGRLDIVARAEGRLVPESRVQVVQPLDRGRVTEILVEEGERVAAGQTLLRMDSRSTHAELERYGRQLQLARLQRRRIESTLNGESLEPRDGDDPELFRQVHVEYVSERRAYREEKARLQAELERTRNELEVAHAVRDKLVDTLAVDREYEQAYARLGRTEAVARLDILERRRDRLETETELRTQDERIETLRGRIEELERQLEAMTSRRRERLVRRRNELTANILGLEADLEQQQIRDGMLELTAPRAGTVKNLAVHTQGSVVPSGTVLLSIVPTGERLRAEVLVSNSDVGFVQPGQEARVKLQAYPFQRFGTIEGRVEMVGPDAQNERQDADRRQQGRYRAFVELGSQILDYEGERLHLRPGMQVLAEIKLGERSVLEYVLSPVSKTVDYAGKER